MPTTQWTLIARLRAQDEGQARSALDELCRAYHYPLYCYIRRKGLAHHDAEDALHDFLAKLLRHESFGVADSEKGRLRTFLLTALQRFLASRHKIEKQRTTREVSAEAEAALARAEGRFLQEPATTDQSPDRLYDQQWAQELMSRVLLNLRARYEDRGRAALFETLQPVLLSGGSLHDHDSEALCAALDIRPGTLRTALSRLMKHYHEELRNEVLQTVEDRSQAKEEFETLMSAFRREG